MQLEMAFVGSHSRWKMQQDITPHAHSNSTETSLVTLANAGLSCSSDLLFAGIFAPWGGPNNRHTSARPAGKESPHCRAMIPPAHQYSGQLFKWHIVGSASAWRERGQVIIPQPVLPKHSLPCLASLHLLCPVNGSLVFCFKVIPRIRNWKWPKLFNHLFTITQRNAFGNTVS